MTNREPLTAAQHFEKEGFVVFRGLLSPEEVAGYKVKLEKLSGLNDNNFEMNRARNGGWAFGDGVTKLRDWWPLITHKGLVSAVRQTLGPNARYTQHSDFAVHHGGVGWHRDSANRKWGVGPDWDERREPYKVARVGIYLQNYAQSGSALGFIPGSHRDEFKLAGFEINLQGMLRQYLNRKDILLPLITAKTTWVRTEPGDCVIFNQRIYHTGSRISGPKYAIFLSYGIENEHSRRHRRYYLHDRKELKYEDFNPELKQHLRESDLLLEV